MDNPEMHFPTRPTPRPWREVGDHQLAGLAGVLTDIDDTLTSDGAIEPQALEALGRLSRAGLPVIAITGRPMGWSEPFARDWPIAAIVAENGGVMLWRDQGAVQLAYAQDEATRARHALTLKAVADEILRTLPHARLARDSAGRVTDIAVDHAEFERLDADDIARVVHIMRARGLHATVSSIHINGWLGEHDKWSGARWAVQRCLGRALDPSAWVYVGDSANDQPMFERIALSVGVANIVPLLPALDRPPAWITTQARGAGFAEVASRLIAAQDRR